MDRISGKVPPSTPAVQPARMDPRPAEAPPQVTEALSLASPARADRVQTGGGLDSALAPPAVSTGTDPSSLLGLPSDWDDAPAPAVADPARAVAVAEIVAQVLGPELSSARGVGTREALLVSKRSLDEIRRSLFVSPEGQAYKARAAAELVATYRDALGDEIETYLQLLDEGRARQDVEALIAQHLQARP